MEDTRANRRILRSLLPRRCAIIWGGILKTALEKLPELISVSAARSENLCTKDFLTVV